MSEHTNTISLPDGSEHTYTYTVPEVVYPWNQSDGLTFAIGHAFSTRANDYYQQALWYAWGHHDAGAYGDTLTLDDGFRFAAIVRDATECYVRERAYFLRSILDMWANYCLLIGAHKV